MKIKYIWTEGGFSSFCSAFAVKNIAECIKLGILLFLLIIFGFSYIVIVGSITLSVSISIVHSLNYILIMLVIQYLLYRRFEQDGHDVTPRFWLSVFCWIEEGTNKHSDNVISSADNEWIRRMIAVNQVVVPLLITPSYQFNNPKYTQDKRRIKTNLIKFLTEKQDKTDYFHTIFDIQGINCSDENTVPDTNINTKSDAKQDTQQRFLKDLRNNAILCAENHSKKKENKADIKLDFYSTVVDWNLVTGVCVCVCVL